MRNILRLPPLAAIALIACETTDAVDPAGPATPPALATAAASFTVTTTADAGAGSLRQAILDANAAAGADRIEFAIPAATDPGCDTGTGVCSIVLATALPELTDQVEIDGYTQAGADPNTGEPGEGLNAALTVELVGNQDINTGIVLQAPGSTVRGLVVNRFGLRHIIVSTDSSLIEGNFIGVDPTGTVGYEPRIGMTTSGTGNTIRGNLVSGGVTVGIELVEDGNVVTGNFLGTDITGTAELGNNQFCIRIDEAADNVIGGLDPDDRNLVSGCFTGIEIMRTAALADAARNRIVGNYVGTDVTGTDEIGNGHGILLAYVDGNVIGGTEPGAGNVISGNGSGVRIYAGSENEVLGNLIGTDPSGAEAIGNSSGVVIVANATDNVIGGGAPGAGNVISGNVFSGVSLAADDQSPALRPERNTVRGNLIGVAFGGVDPLPNDTGISLINAIETTIANNVISTNEKRGVHVTGSSTTGTVLQNNFIGTNAVGDELGNAFDGILVDGGASQTTIGGTAGHGNTIAYNGHGPFGAGDGIRISGTDNTISFNTIRASGEAGIYIAGGAGNAILSNSIVENDDLGIDLLFRDITDNDEGDADGGANLRQNYPVLTSAISEGGGTVVEGHLNSTASATFHIQLFGNVACDASGFGEGETLIGEIDVMTDDGGNVDFSLDVMDLAPLGTFVTATATDAENNTSEFSACAEVREPNSAPNADAGGPYEGDEGASIGFDGTGSTDPDGDELTYEWDFGDDSTASGSATPDHAYVDDGTFTVSLTVTDPGGLGSTATSSVTVANVAPEVDAGADTALASGGTMILSGDFSDPGVEDGPWTTEIDWGDGSDIEAGTTTDQSAAVTGNHRYVAPGTYTVRLTVTDKDDGSGSDVVSVEVQAVTIAIDIKPGSDPNSINLGANGNVPVAILSTADFDARSVNPVTLRLADAMLRIRGNGTPQAAPQDVNGDGWVDLVVHMEIEGMTLTAADVEATLTGETMDGTAVEGVDSVRVVPPEK